MKRLYSLFERQGKRWVRISNLAFPKDTAVRMFQGALLAPLWADTAERSLRPVNGTVPNAG